MKFFCPQCSAPIESAGEASHATCADCGRDIDLSQLHTSAGQPFVPIVLDLSGQDLGPYHLQRVLGSGGMGTVYLATDKRSQQVCALKLLFPQFSTQAEMLQRFQREAALLKDLNHRHIVRYIDQGESEDRHYLVMEYIEGESLDKVLQAGPIEAKRAIEIAGQICEALDAAHAKSIVHRDLKPANIILSPQGLKVLDFGIAHIGLNEHTLTRTDAVIGSLNYMSPEQRSSSKEVDARSDLFSLGVIIYRMLTGELPMGAFAPISHFRPKLGRGFDKLSRRLLAPSPEQRPANAAALLKDLQRLGRGPNLPVKYRLAIAVSIAAVAVYVLIYSLVPTAEADRIEPALPEIMHLQKDLSQANQLSTQQALGKKGEAPQNATQNQASPEPNFQQAQEAQSKQAQSKQAQSKKGQSQKDQPKKAKPEQKAAAQGEPAQQDSGDQAPKNMLKEKKFTARKSLGTSKRKKAFKETKPQRKVRSKRPAKKKAPKVQAKSTAQIQNKAKIFVDDATTKGKKKKVRSQKTGNKKIAQPKAVPTEPAAKKSLKSPQSDEQDKKPKQKHFSKKLINTKD